MTAKGVDDDEPPTGQGQPSNPPSKRRPAKRIGNHVWRLPIILAFVLTSILATITLIVFQDNVTRFAVKPRTPFQTSPTPPPPNYTDRSAWFMRPEASPDAPPSASSAPKAAIFYVHGGTYYSRQGWNAPYTDEKATEILKTIAAPNELGPFKSMGHIYAPYYRQATLFSFFTMKYDGVAAHETAFEDVNAAFKEFLQEADDRAQPIILVGYGQGGLYVLGLLQKYFQTDPKLNDRLAAAYVIDHATSMGFFMEEGQKTPPCTDPNQIRCVIGFAAREASFKADIERLRQRTLMWNNEGRIVPKTNLAASSKSLCINPLSWRNDETYMSADKHIGAASATGLGLRQTPPAIAHALGAQCDDGILLIDKPSQSYLRRRHWFGAHWKNQHFNLFYHDLRQDAARRLGKARPIIAEAARSLEPIGTELDLGVSPINKVPE